MYLNSTAPTLGLRLRARLRSVDVQINIEVEKKVKRVHGERHVEIKDDHDSEVQSKREGS